ncbi:MAG: 1,4-dihydroxy-2-naphthoate octaprenyltransferase [Bacteroidota bacterium]|jgi:1,4-dihydroxy-2-naphthoate octaprenyltransferase
MALIKTWISAFRLRTLPLASAAVLTGLALADTFYSANWSITLLCWLTAVSLQVLSNLANDYGDFMKGTDNDKRIGNMRALQSGIIKPAAMLRMVIFFVLLSLCLGTTLLWQATHGQINYAFAAFFALGLAAIASAIKYTIGKNAYGYAGLGDIFVFIFFGPVAVIGTFLLNSGMRFTWADNWPILLPATAIGLLCSAVLNVNNIRDIENDKNSGKFTLPVIWGEQAAKLYHLLLLAASAICWLIYFRFDFYLPHALMLIPAFILIIHVYQLWQTPPSVVYNRFLKQLSVATLLLAAAFYFSLGLIKAFQLVQAIQLLK